MNCGIEVLKRLNELVDEDLSEVIACCEKKVCESGLSLAVLYDELNKVKPCCVFMSLKILEKTPYIIFMGFKKKGHYMLVEEVNRKVKVYDPAGRYVVLSRFHFYMIWSKIALVFMV